jgi:uncharacterized protein (DUF1778 family)
MSARLDLTMKPEDKELLASAAALSGTTMANFVRMAARDRARQVVEQESRIVLSEQDFVRFAEALQGKFAPNAALKRAMLRASKVKST